MPPPPDIPRRSNSNLRGRPPSDAVKPDSEAFNDAVQQVKSTGSVDAAARKLALYAKMTGGNGSGSATAAVGSTGISSIDAGKGQNGPGNGNMQSQKRGDDGDVEMAEGVGTGRVVKAAPIQGTFKRLSRPAVPAASAASAASSPRPAATSALALAPGKRDPFDDPEEQAYMAHTAQKQEQERGDKGGNGSYMAEEDECAVDDDDMDEDEAGAEPEVVHLQEIVEGLWVGDLVAAMDTEGLKARGITNILSLLRPKIQFTSDFAVFPLEIDDSPDTDILTHLPTCVAWIGEALRRRERARERVRRSSSQSVRRRTSTSSTKSSRSPTSPLNENGTRDHLRENTPPEERDVLIRHLPQTTPGGVLVHCQAGMSRSATTAAAYLMTALSIPPDAAVDIIRSKRPVVDPSQTFWHQLSLFYSADGRVSLRDRETRQFYMERTTTKFMNRGGQPDISHMAKYPATPTASSPPTPTGSHGKRKIRCKMCRRHLAVREHMMDHILDQSPASRPRTPSIGQMSAAMTPILPQDAFAGANGGGGARERRASVVSDVINPLTGLPGARSRHASMSSDRPALESLSIPNSSSSVPSSNASQGSVPTPRSRSMDVTASGFGMTAMTSRSQSSQGYTTSNGSRNGAGANGGDGMVVHTPVGMTRSNSVDNRSSPTEMNRSPSSSGFGATVRRKSSLSQMQSANDSISTNAKQYRSADQIYAHLPPQLAALRMAQNGGTSPSAGQEAPNDAMAVDGASPPSSPELDSHNPSINSKVSGPTKTFPAHPQYPPNHPLANLHAAQSAHSPHVPHKNEGARGAARRMSMLALTPTEGNSPGAQHGHQAAGSGANSPARERRGSGFGFGGEIATGGPPILVNNKCSGYFVEPLTWMEPVLASGQISGKLVCPNDKCGAKIGNYDWAGVQCGCKEWVTPGFCISRSKVDEVW